jgi:hypothetical protein
MDRFWRGQKRWLIAAGATRQRGVQDVTAVIQALPQRLEIGPGLALDHLGVDRLVVALNDAVIGWSAWAGELDLNTERDQPQVNPRWEW